MLAVYNSRRQRLYSIKETYTLPLLPLSHHWQTDPEREMEI